MSLLNEAKTIITLLEKRNYNAYFIGSKCRVQLHNHYHHKKLKPDKISLLTNA